MMARSDFVPHFAPLATCTPGTTTQHRPTQRTRSASRLLQLEAAPRLRALAAGQAAVQGAGSGGGDGEALPDQQQQQQTSRLVLHNREQRRRVKLAGSSDSNHTQAVAQSTPGHVAGARGTPASAAPLGERPGFVLPDSASPQHHPQQQPQPVRVQKHSPRGPGHKPDEQQEIIQGSTVLGHIWGQEAPQAPTDEVSPQQPHLASFRYVQQAQEQGSAGALAAAAGSQPQLEPHTPGRPAPQPQEHYHHGQQQQQPQPEQGQESGGTPSAAGRRVPRVQLAAHTAGSLHPHSTNGTSSGVADGDAWPGELVVPHDEDALLILLHHSSSSKGSASGEADASTSRSSGVGRRSSSSRSREVAAVATSG